MTAAAGGLLSAEDFAAIQREGFRTELVRGEFRAMPPTFGDHGRAAMRLSALLGAYIIEHNLGEVYAAETGFLLSRNPDTVRAPDFAFIQASRVTPQTQAPMWNPVIPDLVVEVVSSGDRAKDVADKIQMWLDAGVRLLWAVYPSPNEVIEHRPNQPPHTLASHATLDGAEVVPGFTLPVSRIFG